MHCTVCSRHILTFIFREERALAIPILQMEKLRLREVKATANKEQITDQNPGFQP